MKRIPIVVVVSHLLAVSAGLPLHNHDRVPLMGFANPIASVILLHILSREITRTAFYLQEGQIHHWKAMTQTGTKGTLEWHRMYFFLLESMA